MPRKEENALENQIPEISKEAKKVLNAILYYYQNKSEEKKKEELIIYYKFEDEKCILMIRNKYSNKKIEVAVRMLFELLPIMEEVRKALAPKKINIQKDLDGSEMIMWRITKRE